MSSSAEGDTASAPPGDPGLFGPDSVTWRVNGDPSMALGGLRALLLQAVHPLAMAGVAQHSGFRDDPWGRLFRTADYVGMATFGGTDEARRAGARVRGLHRRLAGIEPESGTAYRVDDPELLRWVHVSEVESFLSTARRSGLRLSDDEADAYYTEQLAAAELVGLDRREVPATCAQVAEYYQRMHPQLRVTASAREAARFVLFPPMPRWVGFGTPARPAWAGLATVAFGLLPRWARRLYRLPGLPTTDVAAVVAARGIRLALGVVPETLSEGPHRKAARRRLAQDSLPG